MKVLSFGEILWDIIDDNAHLGGAPLNFAAHSAQCGADSYMISRLGKDEYGEEAYRMLPQVKVDNSLVQFDPQYPTGTVDVFLKKGQPTYTIHPHVAYDYIDYNELPDSFSNSEFDVFYFGTLAQRERTSRDTLLQILESKSFSSKFYDVNFRKDCFTREIVLQSLKNCDVIKLNDEEVEIISEFIFSRHYSIEDFMKACHERYGHKVIIVTAGALGCHIFSDNKMNTVPGKQVVVADAVGAGDSFSASFMYKYFLTGDPIKAAQTGNHIGGFVASQHGAIPAYTEEIFKMLRED